MTFVCLTFFKSSLQRKKKKKKKTYRHQVWHFFFFCYKNANELFGDLFQKKSHSVFHRILFDENFWRGGGGIWNLEEAEKLWLNIFFYK